MRGTLCGFLAAAALAAPALAGDLYLVHTEDLTILSDGVNTPAFFVGNNPSAICLRGGDLFVAGFNNTGAPANGRIVKIENIFGTRSFRNVRVDGGGPLDPPSFDVSLPPNRGHTGMSYRPGAGLLVSYDSGGAGTQGAYKLYDIDTQLNPILSTLSPAGTSPRGGAGPAWDSGFNAQGFDTDDNGIYETPGPIACILDFTSYGGVQQRGPFGVRPRDSVPGAGDGLSVILGRIYDADSQDAGPFSNAPVTNALFSAAPGNPPDDPTQPGDSRTTISGTFWRDVDINLATGMVVARANNDLVIVHRGANNGNDFAGPYTNGGVLVDLGNAAFVNYQTVQIVSGWDTGDFIIFNDRRSSGAASFESVIKGCDSAGNLIPLAFKNPDGSTATFAAGVGAYDFSWDAANERLAVSDFANRLVYIFAATPPTVPCWPVCAGDFDGDDDFDSDDVTAFFTEFDAGGGCADADGDEDSDSDDVIEFFRTWEAGSCD